MLSNLGKHLEGVNLQECEASSRFVSNQLLLNTFVIFLGVLQVLYMELVRMEKEGVFEIERLQDGAKAPSFFGLLGFQVIFFPTPSTLTSRSTQR